MVRAISPRGAEAESLTLPQANEQLLQSALLSIGIGGGE
ncbi:MAG: hypothetical protein HW398_1143 [Acidobacteria bacterium]|nr:hypothetical protein [Acidobacteriota bacterium]